MTFKNKSKKVFNKRSHRERSHRERSHRERSRRERSRRERSRRERSRRERSRRERSRRNKKRNTRKRTNKFTNKNMKGGVKGTSVEELQKKASIQAKERNERLIKRNIKTTPIVTKLKRANAMSSAFKKKLINTKEWPQEPTKDPICYTNGPDREFVKEIDALNMYFINPENQRVNPEGYTAYLKFNKEILQRQGQVRCREGLYVSYDFPVNGDNSPVKLNCRLKFVGVKDINSHQDKILVDYAYLKNSNYVGQHILKWTDTDDQGQVTPRLTEKNVEIIDTNLMQQIEDYGRTLPGVDYGDWDSLLMTKTENPDMYKYVIEQYFLNTRGMTAEDISNTLFDRSIDELSHSAIPYLYPNWKTRLLNENGIPDVYFGAEGVFYKKQGDNQLYFVICNLSGHYKTAAELMLPLQETLEKTYGYRITLFTPPPPTPPSSMDTDDSYGSTRENYRRFITNDPDIQTFEQASAKLESADGSVVSSNGLTVPSHSSAFNMRIA